MQNFNQLLKFNTQISDVGYMTRPERDTAASIKADKMMSILIGSIACIAAVVFVSSVALAASPSHQTELFAAHTTARGTVALTLSTASQCAPGEHVAAKIIDGSVKAAGCWMQPTSETVEVRFGDTSKNYKMASFKQLSPIATSQKMEVL